MSFKNEIINLYKKMDLIKKTPLDYNIRLSKKYNANIFLKREDLQFTRSYKVRPALSTILSTNINSSIVCASAGNFAQSVAFLSNKLNIPANIFVPKTCNQQKVNRIKQYSNIENCHIHFSGNIFDECLEEAIKFSNENKYTFLHPYDSTYCINGNATIGLELEEQMDNIDIVIGSIGGGGLMGGISYYMKNCYNNKCSIYGVESYNSDCMKQSVEQNKIIKLNNNDTFIDGSAVKQPGIFTYNICKNYIDDFFTVSNNRVSYDAVDIYQEDGIILELSSVMPISVLEQMKERIIGKNVVLIMSGSNNDIKKYNEIYDRKLIYENKLHYYIITFYQKPGQLKNFIENVLDKHDDIIRFEYLKKNNMESGNVLIGIETNNVDKLHKKMSNYKYMKINEDDILYKFLI